MRRKAQFETRDPRGGGRDGGGAEGGGRRSEIRRQKAEGQRAEGGEAGAEGQVRPFAEAARYGGGAAAEGQRQRGRIDRLLKLHATAGGGRRRGRMGERLEGWNLGQRWGWLGCVLRDWAYYFLGRLLPSSFATIGARVWAFRRHEATAWSRFSRISRSSGFRVSRDSCKSPREAEDSRK